MRSTIPSFWSPAISILARLRWGHFGLSLRLPLLLPILPLPMLDSANEQLVSRKVVRHRKWRWILFIFSLLFLLLMFRTGWNLILNWASFNIKVIINIGWHWKAIYKELIWKLSCKNYVLWFHFLLLCLPGVFVSLNNLQKLHQPTNLTLIFYT